jgi:hypothetical protein
MAEADMYFSPEFVQPFPNRLALGGTNSNCCCAYALLATPALGEPRIRTVGTDVLLCLVFTLPPLETPLFASQLRAPLAFGEAAFGRERMADDLKRRQPEDATRVNVNESWEVKYWTNRFGVTETKLRQAVNAVGVSASKVEAWLKKN